MEEQPDAGQQISDRVNATILVVDDESPLSQFKPFSTTKPVGQGTGLSLSWPIIERHGGKIEVDGEPGKGATFTVTLPLGPTSSSWPRLATTRHAATRHRRRERRSIGCRALPDLLAESRPRSETAFALAAAKNATLTPLRGRSYTAELNF